MPTQSPDQIDRRVASNLKLFREACGINQKTLGQFVAVSPQQIHKYDRELNRLSAGMLFSFHQFLDVHIEQFFIENVPN